jgi:polyisoprenoid-binding protein YceI
MRLKLVLLSLFIILLVAPTADAASRSNATHKPAKAPPAASLLDVQLFQIDSAHSSIEFAVPWMALTRVKGTFTEVLGTIGYDANDLTRSSVTVVIKMPSITTWNEHRDRDLKSPSFFDVQKYPTALFSSRAIEKKPDGYVMRGPLTMHGVTKEIEVPFTFIGQVDDSGGLGHRLGFEGHFSIDRKEFGILGPAEFNKLVPKMNQLLIGQNVDLTLSIQGWMWTPNELGDATSDSLYRVITAKGIDAASKQYRDQRAHTPDSLMAVDEGVINAVGYHLLRNNHVSEARGMFQLETEAYPNAGFGYVGLAQTQATLGNRELAIQSCETALEKNPSATRALEILRRINGKS